MATPPGKGAIAVVRLSGVALRALVRKHFRPWSPPLRKRRPQLGEFLDEQGLALDQVLLTWFPAPASYTGQEVFEISCHGSPFIARRLVECLLESGARLAEPGEFTKRAFLSGKLDLIQAEAIRDLVDSQTAFQAKIATEQLEGKLSQQVSPVKQELIRIISHLETRLEFVEEEVSPDSREQLAQSLAEAQAQIEELGRGFRIGRIVSEGAQVVLAGKPNTGKSSIFNSLLADNRAIVTATPGTTRDALTETISLQGVPLRLVDTAGIRVTGDVVESLGVEKSLEFLRESDLVLFVVEANGSFDGRDWEIFRLLKGRTRILVVNKVDLPMRLQVPETVRDCCENVVEVSALERRGLGRLRAAMLSVLVPGGNLEQERFLVTNIRQKRCLDRAAARIGKGLVAQRNGLSEEYVLYDLRKSLEALGELTGETSVEDILGQIFSSFCVGK